MSDAMKPDLQKTGDATRMLGACDGIISAIVAIKSELAMYDLARIDPRHTKKLSHVTRVRAPLLRLEQRLTALLRETQAALNVGLPEEK